jgi:acetoin utilization protein AcuB
MQEYGIRHLPVIEEGEVVGVVSERDILSNSGKNWSKMMKIRDVMNPSILSAHENDSLGEVAFELSSQKKGSAIILDNNGELAGIFTTTDALNALVEIFLN